MSISNITDALRTDIETLVNKAIRDNPDKRVEILAALGEHAEMWKAEKEELEEEEKLFEELFEGDDNILWAVHIGDPDDVQVCSDGKGEE